MWISHNYTYIPSLLIYFFLLLHKISLYESTTTCLSKYHFGDLLSFWNLSVELFHPFWNVLADYFFPKLLLSSIPGLGRSPGGGNGNHSSVLAWGNLMDRGHLMAIISPAGMKVATATMFAWVPTPLMLCSVLSILFHSVLQFESFSLDFDLCYFF